ncbi:hypothetical protein ABES25_16830 [Bacillus gobiensis]|uniref:hypothetical protein n=1 Tax=Bacillus gobiensis TaxID=1441095 RepID=UPI003D1D6A3B
MSNILSWITSIFGLSILGIVGFVFTYLSWKNGGIRQRLLYYASSINLIEKNKTTPEELTLFYREKEVPRLTRTSFILFKTGYQTILGENIIKEDPIRLEFPPETKILDYSITKTTRDVNAFMVNQTADNVLEFDFRFLDSKDGACITILHTGNNTPPKLTGTIMGLPNGFHEATNRVVDPLYSKVIFSALHFGAPFIFLYFILGGFKGAQRVDEIQLIIWAAIGLGVVEFILYPIYKYTTNIGRNKIPKNLRSDDMNIGG